MNRNEIIFILEKAPLVLEELISEIPQEMLKVRRRPGKWSIHENACHLAEVHPMMIERFTRFKNELNPVIKPYLPGTADTPDDYLKDLNLDECIIRFADDRRKLINIVKSFSE